MTYAIAVDIGGTCTDCVSVDSAGRLSVAKTFSTPPDFSVGIVDGLKLLASAVGKRLDEMLASTTIFLHSTTVAENAIVDGTMATAGLITTAGFEDTLSAMRGGFGRWSGLSEQEKRDPIHTKKPPELITRALIRGIDERSGPGGEQLIEPDETQIEDAVKELFDAGIESLAVCLLWSFLAPEGEARVEAIAKRLGPGIFVSVSHRIAPSLGEYERTSTTALNARLEPVVADYLARLQRTLRELGFHGVLLVMQAYGGLLPASEASARPIGMIESGPVGGVIGSRVVGEWLGTRDVIAADMGGTTFKVSVVRDGLIDYERESMVMRYHFAAPKLDITSLGLAGGSIVSIDPRTGVPALGPQSAGSFPGPVCYGNGGEEPTVTDVDAILGYLHPAFFLGGTKDLDVAASRQAFLEKVAVPLGMTLERAASEIYRLTNSHIFDMLHRTTVERGLDPRGFTLVSIGGTAGMHVMSYATKLGVERVVVPSTASVHSATGLLHSDIVHEEQTTRPLRLPVEAVVIESVFNDLSERVRNQFRLEGFDDDEIRIARSIDMRYSRQANILSVPVDGNATFDDPLLGKTIDRFEDLYRQRYGRESGFRDAGIEFVSFRLRGIGYVQKPVPGTEPITGVDPRNALIERRHAWVDDRGEFREIEGYEWDRLRPGNVIKGPAIVWTPITTVVLRSVDTAEMDERANLVVIPSSSSETGLNGGKVP
jgi:N-methylhydantoinase A